MSENLESSANDYLVTLLDELQVAAQPVDANITALVVNPPDGIVAQVVRLSDNQVIVGSPGLEGMELGPVTPHDRPGSTSRQVPNPLGPGDLLVKTASAPHASGMLGVVVGVSMQQSSRLARVLALGIGLGVPTLSLGVAISVWYSVRSALRPVEQLAAEADRAAGGHHSWRLPATSSLSELRHLTDRLNSLLERIRTAREHERLFLDDASHELRTPIAVARAELDLVQSSTGDSRTRDALSSAIEELDRLDTLAADLLTLAKTRASDGPKRELVALGGLIRHQVARLMRDPKQRGIELTVDGDASAEIERDAIERAVNNLLINSLRLCQEKVSVTINETDSVAEISVRDDGPGFPSGMLERATDRFARDSNRSEGTGLGLAITQAIVAAHGGTIHLENPPEGGAAVMVELPRRNPPNERMTE